MTPQAQRDHLIAITGARVGPAPKPPTPAQRKRSLFDVTGEALVTQKERGIRPPWEIGQGDEKREMKPDAAWQRMPYTGQIASRDTRNMVNLIAASGGKVPKGLLAAAQPELQQIPSVKESLRPPSVKIMAGRRRGSQPLAFYLGGGAKKGKRK